MSVPNPQDRARGKVLDFDEAVRIAHLGVWRASAFYTIARSRSDAGSFNSFQLGTGVGYDFWGAPIPEEKVIDAISEFDHWVLGCCLKELDQHFSLFLSRCFLLNELIMSRGKDSVSIDKRCKEFDDIPGTVKKYNLLGKAVPLPDVERFLRGFQGARNALTHGAGLVRRRDLTGDDLLDLAWTAIVMTIDNGEEKISFRSQVIDTHNIPNHIGKEIVAEKQEVGRSYQIGERVEIDDHELGEICFFYHGLASEIAGVLVDRARDQGIVIRSKDE